MKIYIFFHANCYDGFGAAFAAYLYFKEKNADQSQIKYIPVSCGKPLPEKIEDGSTVYILDFSYPKEILLALKNRVKYLKVIDHHKTAEEDLKDLKEFCIFDMNKSGAVLSWEYFFPSEKVPQLFLYLQDCDLWTFALPFSKEISIAMRLYPFSFEVWETLDIENLRLEGISALKLTNRMVLIMADHSRFCILNGIKCPVSNATVFFSEVGEELLKRNLDYDCVAYYLDRKDGKRQWGLRSRKNFDCSVIAKFYGGGGHKNAAGFMEDLVNPKIQFLNS